MVEIENMLDDFRTLCVQGKFTNKGILGKDILKTAYENYELYWSCVSFTKIRHKYYPHYSTNWPQNVCASLALFNALGDRDMVEHFYFYSGLGTANFLHLSDRVKEIAINSEVESESEGETDTSDADEDSD